MKLLRTSLLEAMLLFFLSSSTFSSPIAGFYLPDSVNEMTLRYRMIRNLIVLPFIINDSVKVNLILDTGCRNLVLFGRRFQKLLHPNPKKQIQFSGLGSGNPLYGFLSLNNKVSINEVLGERIPVVIVPNKNILGFYYDVDGVIGYDIFLKFEIELNPQQQTITFRPAARANVPSGYAQVPLRIVDSRPVMSSEIQIIGSVTIRKYDLMIDTGSCLGLLLKTTNINEFDQSTSQGLIGLGFNGPISGHQTTSNKLSLDGFELLNLPTGIIESQWHNYASIGMGILKDYVLILNYCKSYACFRRIIG